MKLIVVILLTALTILVIVTRQFPQVGSSLPVVGTIVSAAEDAGLTEAPGKFLAAGRDLGAVARTHHFGGWHFAAAVLAVLITRKILMWLLR